MTSGVKKLAAAFLAAGLSAGAAWLHRRAALPSSYDLLADLAFERAPGGARVADAARLPRAAVVSVVDGDTLRVLWEGREDRLRYYGVNTPERGDACFEEAARRNAALAGSEVLLAFDERSRDKYGRLLAYAFTPDGKSIDAALVSEGLGRAWTRGGRWRGELESLEDAARREKRGCLWTAPSRGRERRGRRRA